MDDASTMGFVQRVGDLNAVSKHFVDWQGTFFQSLRQRLAFEILHDDEVDAVLAAHVVEYANMRMVQARHRPRFLLEALAQATITGEMGRQDFDSHRTVEPRVLRLVDLPHTPRPDGGKDFVGAELATGTQCHRTAMLTGETVATQINNLS